MARPPQWKFCVRKGIPRIHGRVPVQNQTGMQPMALHLVYTLIDSSQGLFQEIAVWRRLSHPNVLPVLGVSPRLFPLCVISNWMSNGNIMDFTSKHPEVNRFRLVRPIVVSLSIPGPDICTKLAEVASGLQYLHSIGIIHGNPKPVRTANDFYIPR